MTALGQVVLGAALIGAMIVLRLLAQRSVERDRRRRAGGCARLDCATDCSRTAAPAAFESATKRRA